MVNILSGSLPGPNMGRDGTRDALLPRLAAVQASIVATGADVLLPSRCTNDLDFFGEGSPEVAAAPAAPTSTATVTTTPAPVVIPPATGPGPTTTAIMGAPASASDRLSLAADATARGEAQATAIVLWAAGHAAELATWWEAFENAVRSLVGAVAQRAVELRDAASVAGRNLRDFFAAWAVEMQRRWDTLVTTLGIGAGVGAAGGILFLAFLLAYMASRH